MNGKGIACISLALWVAFVGGTTTANAANEVDRAAAEASLKQLRTEISKLKKSLEGTRKSYALEQQALEQADLNIQSNALQLRKLAAAGKQHQREMSRLNNDRENYLDTLQLRRVLLARQIMAAYRLGRESRLKLILNQDNPARLTRLLAYYDYFSHSQAQQISELKKVLQTLDRMQAKISRELSALKTVQSKQQALMASLQNQRAARLRIVADLSAQIGDHEARLSELQKNRRDLELLVKKLTHVLADIPADLGQRLGPAQLQGKLPVPLKGRVQRAFGQPRTAGLRWQGWLINAAIGSEVKSIAYGRVAFSDWLRGYGLLMIIDHGDGFISLYGNNESLLREVGDWVEPGTAICTVGDSPGSGPGLYFEIRKNGKAVDPALWLHR